MSDGASGLLTLLALVAAGLGYGLLGVRLLAGESARPPCALVAGGGIAVLCWLGGWLVAFRLYSRSASIALLALGIAALAIRARAAATYLPRERPRAVPAFLAALAAAALLLRALGSIRSPFVNPCDDWPAYFHLPKLLLESGGLEEPFSFRRLGVLGIAPLLGSFFWPFWTTSGGAVADATLGGLGLWAGARAAVSLASGAAANAVAVEASGLAAVAAALTVPLPNGSPVLLPLAATLLLLHPTVALARGHASTSETRACALLWGALAAFVVGIRTTNIAFPGLLGLAAVALALARRDAAALRRWAHAALAFLLALAPWSLAVWRSSGTPFFPLLRGNYTFASALSAPLPPEAILAFAAGALWTNRIWYPVVLAAAIARRPDARGLAAIVAVALVGTVFGTALTLTGLDAFDVFRYCGPLVVATIAFLFAFWLGGELWRRRAERIACVELAAVVLATLLWVLLPVEMERQSASDEGRGPSRWDSVPMRGVGRNLRGSFAGARAAWRHNLEEGSIAGAADFSRAQAALGRDARILSAVSKPFFWRFDRNTIHTVDCPGQASPPPGMPFFQGPDALADYLRGLGYTHLAFSPPRLDPCLYSLENWRTARRSGVFLWESWAPYFLDFLENEQQLAQRLGTQYRSRDVVVVDLRSAPGGAPAEEP